MHLGKTASHEQRGALRLNLVQHKGFMAASVPRSAWALKKPSQL